MSFIILVAFITGFIGFALFVTAIFNLPFTLDLLIVSIGILINSAMWLIVAEAINELIKKEKVK